MNNLYVYAMSTFLSASECKWIDPKDFDLDKCTRNSSIGCDLDVDLQYLKD